MTTKPEILKPCTACNGFGVVGNIDDTRDCNFCGGTGIETMTTKPEPCPEKVYGYQIPIRGYEYWEFDENPLVGEGHVNIEYVRHDIAAAREQALKEGAEIAAKMLANYTQKRELAIIRATLEEAVRLSYANECNLTYSDVARIAPATILNNMEKK